MTRYKHGNKQSTSLERSYVGGTPLATVEISPIYTVDVKKGRESIYLKTILINYMRKIQDPHTNKWLVYATSQKDVTRYLWEYHKISTDIMKCHQSWYINVNGTWFGVGAKTLDTFPIQHWAELYKWLRKNPDSILYCSLFRPWTDYLLKSSKDITIDHSKYKSYLT